MSFFHGHVFIYLFFLQHALPLAGFLLFYEDVRSHFSIFNSSGKYVMFLFFCLDGYIFSEQFTAPGVSARLSEYVTEARGQCGDL